jgi:hypothetical protein
MEEGEGVTGVAGVQELQNGEFQLLSRNSLKSWVSETSRLKAGIR